MPQKTKPDALLPRCVECGHAEHVNKCLQALRTGKPGEDQFCLCNGAEYKGPHFEVSGEQAERKERA